MVPGKWRVACPNFSLVDAGRSTRPKLLILFSVIVFGRLCFICADVPTCIEIPPIFVGW
jgi:hypothetical protein